MRGFGDALVDANNQILKTTTKITRRRLVARPLLTEQRRKNGTTSTKKKALRKISIYLTKYEKCKKDVKIDYHSKMHFHLNCVVCFFFNFWRSIWHFGWHVNYLMKMKLTLHVRKYRISLKTLSFGLEKRGQDFFFYFFPSGKLFRTFRSTFV